MNNFQAALHYTVLGAFRLYDADSDGFITHEEMYNVMDAVYRMEVKIHKI